MVGFASSPTRSTEDLNFLDDYCLLTREGGEIQLICDELARLYAVNTPQSLRQLNPESHSLLNLFPQLGSLLHNARGSVVRTTQRVQDALRPYLHEAAWDPIPTVSLTLYPVFQGKILCELYNVTLHPDNRTAAASSDCQDRRRSLTRQVPNCLIDARTGLFLEASEDFQTLVGQDAEQVLRARCEELGMNDLLLLATLNADRKCFFQSQFRSSTTPRWFLSESCRLDDHECIRIWSPEQVRCPESHLVGFQLSRAYCDSWKDKPERVLICDDNELLLDTCASIMDWAQIAYDVAHNGKEALQQLEQHSYHCVFLDLNMPRLNGFDTARLIRQSRRDYRSVPIVAMTATPLSQADLARQLKHFDAILQKPFDVEDVKTAVNQAREHLWVQRHTPSCNASGSLDRSELPAAAHAQQDYEPTPFMQQFGQRPEVMEGLRTHILRSLESQLAFLETLEAPGSDEAAIPVVQQVQSMAISIGARKLATHAGILLSQLLSDMPSASLTAARSATLLCIEEALCFYNTVDWKTFALGNPVSPAC